VSDSDVHPGAVGPEGEARLLEFLATIQGQADSLYLLGDMFEFWFEYRTVIPKRGFGLLARLAELRRAGTALFFLKGNHDFWFQSFLQRELGAESVHDELETTIDGKRVHLSHGDGLDRGAVPRLFRALMRNQVNGALYSLFHPDVGVGLARWVARRSRELSARPYLLEDMARFAQAKLAAGCDVVFMAHSHVPEERRFGAGVYINVGDWIRSLTYGVIRDGEASLERFGAGQ